MAVPHHPPLPLLPVADTHRAYQDLARAWRRQLGLPLVAVTGSAGKATTRDWKLACCHDGSKGAGAQHVHWCNGSIRNLGLWALCGKRRTSTLSPLHPKLSDPGLDIPGSSGTIIVRRKPFRACPLSEVRARVRAFVFPAGPPVTYFAYLDEFGHIGPYVSRKDSKHNDSPMFGLACFTLPSEQVRGFGIWFFQRLLKKSSEGGKSGQLLKIK